MTDTRSATCVVCGTADSGYPGEGMTAQAHGASGTPQYHVCAAHVDAVQVGLDGYALKRKKTEHMLFRRMTVAEAKALRQGQEVHFIHFKETYGQFPRPDYPVIRRAKVTSIKTWKTRPDDVLVKWSFGMYVHTSSERDGDSGFMHDLVVLVQPAQP